MKQRKSDIDINDDSWGVISQTWFSNKDKPIKMIRNAY